MKIIFLDFDGVMGTARYELILRMLGCPSVDAYGTVFDPECVWNLTDTFSIIAFLGKSSEVSPF